MEAYTGFAEVYDIFMDNIPYEEWGTYLLELMRQYGIDKGIVLDMGCGTGNITELLAHKGYDMIGIDNAQDMLEIAMQKKEQKGLNILYLLQDMRELELYGTVSAVVSVCDSINYILEEEELVQVFRLVNNYLEENGIFIFDLNTEYKYQELLGDNVIAENRQEASFIWENYYYKEEKINEYQLTLYVKEEKKENGFIRYEETHFQRAYSLETIKQLLQKAGMEYVTAYDAFTKQPPKLKSERIYIIAREGQQENKLYVNDKIL